MNDTLRNGDYQIEVFYKRGCLLVIFHRFRPVMDLNAIFFIEFLYFFQNSGVILKADKIKRHFQNREPFVKRNITIASSCLFCSPAPADTDLWLISKFQ